ncbi:MAG TPA: hypothetical protein PK640_02040 [Verrucomicrobiota bacterium]|nr:hypothetical protein [Verrucomicrobiota bacterium]
MKLDADFHPDGFNFGVIYPASPHHSPPPQRGFLEALSHFSSDSLLAMIALSPISFLISTPRMQANWPFEIKRPIGWTCSTRTQTWASSASMPENWPLAAPAWVRMK